VLYKTYLKSLSRCFQNTGNTVTANTETDATSIFILVRVYLVSPQISAAEKCSATSGYVNQAIHGFQQ